MQFHKAMSILAGGLLLTHPILISLGLGSFPLFSTDTPWPMDLGKAALAFTLAMIVFSMTFESMGVDYNVWRFLHKSIVLVLVLGFTHSTWVGEDFKPNTPLIVPGRRVSARGGHFCLSQPLCSHSGPPAVSRERHPTRDGRHPDPAFEPADGNPLPRNPGQFMFLRLVRRGRKSETHPFTIAASPLEPGIVEATIKKSGNFTNTIDQTRAGDAGLVEGPFGRFSLIHMKSSTSCSSPAGWESRRS